MGPPGFFAGEHGGEHELGDCEQILQFPAWLIGELVTEDVPAPEAHVIDGGDEAFFAANDAGLAAHQALQRVLQIGEVEFGHIGSEVGRERQGLQRVGRVDGTLVPLPPLDGFAGLAYLQRFVPPLGEPGHDWRVLVIGGRAFAAMRRVSTHWIHNVAQGARCEPQTLTHGDGPALARLAEAAAAALDMDYAGVDLLPTPHGIQVLEVNGVAAWRGLQGVTRASIAQALVDDLLDRKCAAAAERRQA